MSSCYTFSVVCTRGHRVHYRRFSVHPSSSSSSPHPPPTLPCPYNTPRTPASTVSLRHSQICCQRNLLVRPSENARQTRVRSTLTWVEVRQPTLITIVIINTRSRTSTIWGPPLVRAADSVALKSTYKVML